MVSQNYLPGLASNLNPPISASWVARTTGMSHQRMAKPMFLILLVTRTISRLLKRQGFSQNLLNFKIMQNDKLVRNSPYPHEITLGRLIVLGNEWNIWGHQYPKSRPGNLVRVQCWLGILVTLGSRGTGFNPQHLCGQSVINQNWTLKLYLHGSA
jgi:hypothetical protein